MTILETSRLLLRELCLDDAPFILRLVNEPAWLRFIGDRGIRTLEAARNYLLDGPVASYLERGFGLWLVERREERTPMGICGLIQRPTLSDVDLGFAFLSEFHRQGYATEAARATMDLARTRFGLPRLLAVVSPGNEASLRLLEKLGFAEEGEVCLSQGAPAVQLLLVQL